MDRNAATRLGSKGDVNEVIAHPFFNGIDFYQLQQKTCLVPYKPDQAQMTLKESELHSVQVDSDVLKDIKTEDDQDQIPIEKKFLIT
jgi:hypothetical protein